MILSFVPHPKVKIPFSSSHILAMVEDIENNGVVIKTTSFKEFDSSKFLNSVVSSEFSVNNLLSIGAVNLLKRNFNGDLPSVVNADQFESVPSNLVNAE